MLTDVSHLSQPKDAASVSFGRRILAGWGFPELFLISQTALPAVLYLPGTQPLRVPVRVASYGISLAALAWWNAYSRERGKLHPSTSWLIPALLYLGLMVFHPTTNTFLSGIAQVFMYLSVMAPVFWVPRYIQGPSHLARLLVILLICNGVNSAVGILQVYDPDTWMPKDFSTFITQSEFGIEALSYIGPSAQSIIRPPGLFDAPGAVAGPAMIAGILGLAFFLNATSWWKKLIAIGFAFLGVTVIYLTHVRTSLIILGGMIIIYILLVALRQPAKLAYIAVFLVLIVPTSLALASTLGGESIVDRFSTLLEEDPYTVYYEKSARGAMVENSIIILLPEYPFGAGLGRWGMMRAYFGDESNTDSPMIWAEVQPAAWVLDGGVILLSLYTIAILLALFYEFNLMRVNHSDDDFVKWLPVVMVANLGTIALGFSYVPFTAPIGMQYWFLTGAIYGAVASINKTNNLSNLAAR